MADSTVGTRSSVRADAACCAPARRVVVLLSGGRDSVCLLDVAVELAGPARVARCTSTTACATRPTSDERALRARCASGSASRCEVERRAGPSGRRGNLQAWARDVRYAAADAARARRAARDVAAGHTATDQVETILYRLASSPGRRALLGMRRARRAARAPAARASRREADRRVLRARGLPWREDATNADAGFARNRVRDGARAGAASGAPGGRGERRCAPPRCCATRPRCSTRSSTRRSTSGAAGVDARPSCRARCRRRCARLVVRRLAEDAAGGAVPAARPRRAERGRWRCGAPAPRCSTSAAACAPSSSAACCAARARDAGVRAPRTRARTPGAVGTALDCRAACATRRSARSSSSPTSCSSRVRELGARDHRATTRAATCCWSASSRARSSSCRDLMRAIDVPCEVDFMAVASYGSATDVQRRRADPQGPRRADRGPRRADRRGHRRLRPDAAVPAAQPRRARPGVARGLRAADQARAPQGRPADRATSASRSRTASPSATASTTPSATATCRTWPRWRS